MLPVSLWPSTKLPSATTEIFILKGKESFVIHIRCISIYVFLQDVDFVGIQFNPKSEKPRRMLSDVAQYMVHFRIPTKIHRHMPELFTIHERTCLGVLISG